MAERSGHVFPLRSVTPAAVSFMFAVLRAVRDYSAVVLGEPKDHCTSRISP